VQAEIATGARRSTRPRPRAGRAYGLLAALAVVAAPLSACDKPPREADSKPQVDLLGSMLADESVINAIMGSNEFRVYNTYRSLPGWPQGDVYSQPECLAALANAMEPAYHGSRYEQVRATQLADNGRGTENSVDEAVIGFDNAGDAKAFVAATTQTWNRCANSTLTITSADRRPRHWRMGATQVVDGVQVLAADDPDSTSGWRTSHAMRAANNVVIDVRVTGYAINDQAVRIVNAIAGRNRL
jgi:PknH-like extracellular domain